MRVIDMHTHIFPDRIAAKAAADTAAYIALPEPLTCCGRAGELAEALDAAGIDCAMVFSAAITPRQVEHVNRFIWSEAQKQPRFIPCGTLHAEYANYKEELAWMREHGLYGVKLHPEFQHFTLDDPRLFPMYEEMERTDMFLIAHMGDPRVMASGPSRMLPVARTFPKLRCIATHLGNWGDWDIEKIRPLAKLPNIYTDISSSFSYVADKTPLYPILRVYDPTHVFFGSDFPLWPPGREVERTKALGLEQAFLEDILFCNFARFYHYRAL